MQLGVLIVLFAIFALFFKGLRNVLYVLVCLILEGLGLVILAFREIYRAVSK